MHFDQLDAFKVVKPLKHLKSVAKLLQGSAFKVVFKALEATISEKFESFSKHFQLHTVAFISIRFFQFFGL
jgi:hypothetical protein